MQVTEQEIKDKANALRNLVSFKNKSEDYILSKAEELLHKEKSGMDMTSMFSDRKEIKRARNLLEKYLSDYTIESISDKNTLKEVIYLEIVQQRLQGKLNEYYEKDSKALPIQLVEIIHKNSRSILELKASLGLNREKEKATSVDALAILKVRFKQWLKENQASRTITCPHENCGKMIMLKMKTGAWEAQKHPFFKDRILANEHLIKLYNSKVITRKDVAKVLETSMNYVDWLVEKWSLDVGQEASEKQIAPKEQVASQKAKQVADSKESETCEDVVNWNWKEEAERNANRCPKCRHGFLFCSLTGDAVNWLEQCTSCSYKAIHKNHRLKQKEIGFKNRRKKRLPQADNKEE